MISSRTAIRRARTTAAAPAGSVRTVPFDQQFVFTFTEPPPRKAQRRSIQVSVESPFVAVSIGYGLVQHHQPIRFGLARLDDGEDDAPAPPVPLIAAAAPAPAPAAINFGDIGRLAARQPRVLTRFRLDRVRLEDIASGLATAVVERRAVARPAAPALDLLRTPFRFNQRFAEWLATARPDEEIRLDRQAAAELFETVPTPIETVQFTYALFDEGSGREFQNQPVLSTAGLGGSTGERPFRYFARPIRFEPLATITMSVEQVTPIAADLHVVLHGYKTHGLQQAQRSARRQRATGRRR